MANAATIKSMNSQRGHAFRSHILTRRPQADPWLPANKTNAASRAC